MYNTYMLIKTRLHFVSHYDKPITQNFHIKYVLANILEQQGISVDSVLSST